MTRKSDPAVAIRSLSFAYPRRAAIIRDCTFDVVRGRVLSILGPNGSGKTTLLKLIAGALDPTSGTVTVRGSVAYVPQLMHLSFAYSVLDVVLMGRARHIGLFGTPSASDERAAITALERVGVLSLAARSFDELSGGERQLVALAKALAAEADVLVLDEPTAALDLHHQQLVLQWMRRLARDDGLTIVFSTHQPQHADVVADDAALIFGPGRIVAGAAPSMLETQSLMELFGVDLQRVRVAETQPGRGTLILRWDLENWDLENS